MISYPVGTTGIVRTKVKDPKKSYSENSRKLVLSRNKNLEAVKSVYPVDADALGESEVCFHYSR